MYNCKYININCNDLVILFRSIDDILLSYLEVLTMVKTSIKRLKVAEDKNEQVRQLNQIFFGKYI